MTTSRTSGASLGSMGRRLTGGPVTRTTARRFAVLVFFAAFLMQAAWIVSVPPFRGSDEFDHVYRAASVADGDWMPQTAAPHGRGDLVPVSPRLVDAAQPICTTYTYVGPDNCFAAGTTADGKVLIATAASRYNPLFYAVIGWPAHPFDGALADYVMRLAGSVLTALLLALGAWVVATAFRTNWPRLGFVLAVTPIVAYSNAIPASNGSEIVSGLGLWCCLLGIRANLANGPVVRRLILASVPFAVLLATLRSTGPLYVALIVATVAVLIGVRGMATLWGAHRRRLLLAAVPVALAGLFNLWWMHERPITDLLVPGTYPDPVGYAFEQIPLWFFQSIAAFPMRNQPAPPLVYVAYGLVLIAFATAGVVAASKRERLVIGLAVLTSLCVPLAFTADTYGRFGSIWQGRYGLALSVGVIMLCAVALDEARTEGRQADTAILVGWVLVAFSQVASVLHVLLDEDVHSPLAGDVRWVSHPAWVVAILAVVSSLIWFRAVHGDAETITGHDRGEPATDAADTTRPAPTLGPPGGEPAPAGSSAGG